METKSPKRDIYQPLLKTRLHSCFGKALIRRLGSPSSEELASDWCRSRPWTTPLAHSERLSPWLQRTWDSESFATLLQHLRSSTLGWNMLEYDQGAQLTTYVQSESGWSDLSPYFEETQISPSLSRDLWLCRKPRLVKNSIVWQHIIRWNIARHRTFQGCLPQKMTDPMQSPAQLPCFLIHGLGGSMVIGTYAKAIFLKNYGRQMAKPGYLARSFLLVGKYTRTISPNVVCISSLSPRTLI